MTRPRRVPPAKAAPIRPRAGERIAPRNGASAAVRSVGDRVGLVLEQMAPGGRLPPLLTWAMCLALGLVLATKSVGWPGVGTVLAVGLAVPIHGPRVVESLIEREARRRLPERCSTIAQAVRSGATVLDAMAEAFPADSPGSQRWQQMIGTIRTGRAPGDALRELPTRSEAESLLVRGLQLAFVHGGPVAAGLESLSRRLRDEVDLDDRRRVLTAQARLSAGVLAALPIGFAVATSVLRGDAMWRGAAGIVAGTLGLVCNVIGLLWMLRLIRTGT